METGEKDTKPRTEVIDFEKRRYPRFNIHLPIEYDHVKSSITHTGNISEGGFLISFPKETDVGQYLRLRLFFSLGYQLNRIEMVARVVSMHNHLSEDRNYNQYGVKFIDISPKDRAKLKNLLRNLSSSPGDMIGLTNTLGMRFRTWKLMNSTRVITTEELI
jgi:c-di-GMP-binding flagellar brake protein YcgR